MYILLILWNEKLQNVALDWMWLETLRIILNYSEILSRRYQLTSKGVGSDWKIRLMGVLGQWSDQLCFVEVEFSDDRFFMQEEMSEK